MTTPQQDEDRELSEYDSLEINPLLTSGIAREVEGILRGYEPVADGHGTPLGFDLGRGGGRTEFGFYWEFEDMADAARKIAALIKRHEQAIARKASCRTVIDLLNPTQGMLIQNHDIKDDVCIRCGVEFKNFAEYMKQEGFMTVNLQTDEVVYGSEKNTRRVTYDT